MVEVELLFGPKCSEYDT